MQEEILIKIEEAEKGLGVVFPANIRNFLLSLNDYGHFLGKEEWYFDIYNDVKNGTNTILEDSLTFKEDWKLDAVVLAHNGMGDYLLLLPKLYPKKIDHQLDEIVFVLWHELAEIRIFAYDLSEALDEDFESGPTGDEYVFRINDDDTLEEGFELRRIYDPVSYVEYLKSKFLEPVAVQPEGNGEGEEWLQLHERVNQASEWIEEEKSDKIDEILAILQECVNDEFLGPRAHWLLSKVYMKGIGLPANLALAIDYVQKSAASGNYNAMADLSFYYFKGMGVAQSTLKAIEWMESANEKSEGLMEERLEALKNFQAQKN
jgi:Sel1 repeat